MGPGTLPGQPLEWLSHYNPCFLQSVWILSVLNQSLGQYRDNQHLNMSCSRENFLLDCWQRLSLSSLQTKLFTELLTITFRMSVLPIFVSSCSMISGCSPSPFADAGVTEIWILSLSAGPEAASLTDAPCSAEHRAWLPPLLMLKPRVNGHSSAVLQQRASSLYLCNYR